MEALIIPGSDKIDVRDKVEVSRTPACLGCEDILLERSLANVTSCSCRSQRG